MTNPHNDLSKPLRIAAWIMQIIVAVIYLQTLFFKLTWAPETQIIFENLGGRPAATLAALGELTVAILLLTPRNVLASANALGAVLSIFVIGGAIMSHLTVIGIAIATPDGGNDGGSLFAMALGILLISIAIAFIRRGQLPLIGPKLVKTP